MSEGIPETATKPQELEDAHFEQELCADATRLLYKAMEDKNAYVINGALVLKFQREEEAFHLDVSSDSTKPEYEDYGMRVALCVKDAPPFKRGQWYTVRSREMRKKMIEDTKDGNRNLTLPIQNSDWYIVTDIAEVNKNNEELLETAEAYVAQMGAQNRW